MSSHSAKCKLSIAPNLEFSLEETLRAEYLIELRRGAIAACYDKNCVRVSRAQSVVHGPCVALVAQLLIHEDYVKRALIVDNIVATFVYQCECILVLKFYLCIVGSRAFDDVISSA